jgi:transposase
MAAARTTVVDAFRVPDALWERLEPLLPKARRPRKGGRPRLSYRRVLDGLFYALRTGCHGKAAPRSPGPGAACTGTSSGGRSGGVPPALAGRPA